MRGGMDLVRFSPQRRNKFRVFAADFSMHGVGVPVVALTTKPRVSG
jgi:hypothetical protein